MDWTRIMVPVSGGTADAPLIDAAAALAEPFAAQVVCVHVPADVADLAPWMGDGFLGGVQASVVESIRAAGAESEITARATFASSAYSPKTFLALKSPIWNAIAVEGRLSDVLVFSDQAARGIGPLSEAFRQIVADEQRPTLVVRPGFKVGGVVAVAWDGGKEASRALRTAQPLLALASQVVVLAAPDAGSRKFDPGRIVEFLAARDITSRIQILPQTTDIGPALLQAAKSIGASIMVAGAFGHPRLQEFIFGGATRAFLHADGPSLWLSH